MTGKGRPQDIPEASRPKERSTVATLARGMALASSLGATFVALVSFGALAGLAADRRFETGPWLMLAGLLVGSVSAFYSVYRLVALFQRLDALDAGAKGPRGK